MTDLDTTEWPREIWAFAIDYSEHEVSGTYATSEWATVPRWEGDPERDRPSQRYVDGDIYDSAERYWRERVEALEAKLTDAERRGAERMRERAAQYVDDWFSGFIESGEKSCSLDDMIQAIRAIPLAEEEG